MYHRSFPSLYIPWSTPTPSPTAPGCCATQANGARAKTAPLLAKLCGPPTTQCPANSHRTEPRTNGLRHKITRNHSGSRSLQHPDAASHFVTLLAATDDVTKASALSAPSLHRPLSPVRPHCRSPDPSILVSTHTRRRAAATSGAPLPPAVYRVSPGISAPPAPHARRPTPTPRPHPPATAPTAPPGPLSAMKSQTTPPAGLLMGAPCIATCRLKSRVQHVFGYEDRPPTCLRSTRFNPLHVLLPACVGAVVVLPHGLVAPDALCFFVVYTIRPLHRTCRLPTSLRCAIDWTQPHYPSSPSWEKP